MSVAKTPTEQYREVTNALSTLTERVDNIRNEARDLRTSRDKFTDQANDLRRDIDLLRQRFDDHLKRTEEWDRRRWGLAGLVGGAILSFAANLVVAWVRR